MRLDVLVQRALGVSRSKAQGLIHTGMIRDAAGEPLDKPGMTVPDDFTFEVVAQQPFVSRGGDKLEAAFAAFAFDVRDRVCMDVGASTGGFTDCLLQHGAARVYAIDVGYGQLAWELRQDPRVVVMERTNIRHVTPDQLPERPEVFTVDCSFISLRLVLPPIRDLLADRHEGIALIKPQFEAGRDQVGKGGVVRDEKVREAVVEDITAYAGELGFEIAGVIPSPLLGPAGNREYLAHLRHVE
jgi:23S rRNA (cytidine1920-2'-O)/16S rRNA (cytidine1409-2'-O)-methyltransferase